MPPRSAKRRASGRAKKLTSCTEQPNIESSTLADVHSTFHESEIKEQVLTATEEINNQQENESVGVKPETGEVEQALAGDKEIEQEIVVSKDNSTATEGLSCGVEQKVVESAVVEIVEEERIPDVVMEDHVNGNAEDGVQDGGVEEEEGKTIDGTGNESAVDKSESANVLDVADKVENTAEAKGVVGGENEVGDTVYHSSQVALVPEQNSAKQGTSADPIQDTKTLEDSPALLSNVKGEGMESGNDEDNGKDNKGHEDDENPSVFVHDPLTDRRKQKDLEIFIGRLDKGTVEDDLINVFGKFGEIKAARIVRNSTTKKSRGFAFIRYATFEQAKNALSQLTNGIEVRGKRVKISASQNNDTLYVDNICKTWTKVQVLETLECYGVEHIEDIHLPDDPMFEGKIKGYALLEFSTHSDAMAAFHRLSKPDAVFGCDRSAKVAFAPIPMHPNDDVLSQVKTVYLEGLTDAWNEQKVKEMCKQYGEVTRVKLSQDLGTKRKDFGFISFTSRESAVACVEAINNGQIGESELKIKASISKSHFTGQLQKQGFQGGFKVKKENKVSSTKKECEGAIQASLSKIKGRARSKRAKRKSNMVSVKKAKALTESKLVEEGKSNKSLSATEGQSVGTPTKLGRSNRKRKHLASKVPSHENRGNNHVHSKRPSKKLRGRKRGPHVREGLDCGANAASYKHPYEPPYAGSTDYYQNHAHNVVLASENHYRDMEPHAGYLEPVVREQGRSHLIYLEPPVGSQDKPHVGYVGHAGTYGQPHAGYVGRAGTYGQPHAGFPVTSVRTQAQLHARYQEPTVQAQGQFQGGYLEPAIVTHSRPHVGYLQPAFVKDGQDPYDPGLRSASGHDSHGQGSSIYGRVTAPAPPSYAPYGVSYAGNQGGFNAGSYYQSSGAHLVRREYY